MMTRLNILRLASALCAGTGIAAAAETEIPETPAGYVRTGESESCLRISRIDQLKVINTEQILVEMRNGDTWLQQPRSCTKLRKHFIFVYETFGGELCDTTSVTLSDSTPGLGFAGICMFDKFEKLEKQAAAN